MLTAYASHGDTRHPLLFPRDPEECFYMSVESFDLAERLQTPIFVLSDLDIGMNDWMCPELKWDDAYRPDRGKVLDVDDLREMKKFHRYLDVDGDGIAARTLPGVTHRGAYFTRGSGHNKWGSYTENADDYQEVVDRLLIKWETARKLVPEPVLLSAAQPTEIGIMAFGSSDGAVLEALSRLASDNIHVDYLRLKAFPFNDDVQDFLDQHKTVFVVEQNRDAQMRSLLLLETSVEQDKLVSVLHYNGLPIPGDCVVEFLLKHLDAEVAA